MTLKYFILPFYSIFPGCSVVVVAIQPLLSLFKLCAVHCPKSIRQFSKRAAFQEDEMHF